MNKTALLAISLIFISGCAYNGKNYPLPANSSDKAALYVSKEGNTYFLAGNKNNDAGCYDFYMVESGKKGKVVKNYSITPGNCALVNDAKRTRDGGWVLTGNVNPDGSGRHYFLLKVGSDGKKEWETHAPAGKYADSNAFSILEMSNGNFAISGYAMQKGGEESAIIVITAPDGRIRLEKISESERPALARSVSAAIDNSLYTCGIMTGPVPGESSAVVEKTSAEGRTLWKKELRGPFGSAAGMAGCVLSTGGYAAVCETKNPADNREYLYIVKFDSDGKIEWERAFATGEEMRSSSVIEGEGGELMVAGAVSLGDSGASLMVRISADGNNIEYKRFGKGKFSAATSVAAIPGGYVFSGRTQSRTGGQEVFIIETDGRLDRVKRVF